MNTVSSLDASHVKCQGLKATCSGWLASATRALALLVLFAAGRAFTNAGAVAAVPSDRPGVPLSELGAALDAQRPGDHGDVTPTADGARLRCATQRLEGEATPEGLWLTSSLPGQDATRFSLRAVALGRQAGTGEPVAQRELARRGTVQVEAGLVRWVRPDVVEEYTTCAGGVRQDFVIARKPAGTGELRVELDVRGARVQDAADGARLVLDGSGREMAYNRLQVVDARSRTLAARMVTMSPGSLALVVDDAGAAYPLRIDPTITDANWFSLGDLRGANGHVYAICRDTARGVIYVGGSFTVIGDIVASRVAKWDGHTWSALGAGIGVNIVGDSVRALAVDSAGNLYVGGDFENAGSVPANNIAKWNGNSWSGLCQSGAADKNGVNGSVIALAVDAYDRLFVGGGFTSAGGVAVNNITYWDPVQSGGTWYSMPGMSAAVSALAFDSNGVLHVGGAFRFSNGVITSGITKMGGASWWQAFGSGVVSGTGSDYVTGILFDAAGNPIVCINNSTQGEVDSVLKWNGSSWVPLGTGPQGSELYDMAFDAATNLYVVGRINRMNGVSGAPSNETFCAAKWDGSAWTRVGPFSYHFLYALEFDQDGAMCVGGHATDLGTNYADYSWHLARWTGNNYEPWLANPSALNGSVRALTVDTAGQLYAGGTFYGANGLTVNRVAKWNGSAWSALGTGMDAAVLALAADGANNLYAAGNFVDAGGPVSTRVSKWNGSAWSALGTGMEPAYAVVNALAVDEANNLYAGGTFTSAGGVPAGGLAKWDGSAWSAVGTGLTGQIYAMTCDGEGNLYVGGFITYAGRTSYAVARWDGSAWTILADMETALGDIHALAWDPVKRMLYAGGRFGVLNDVPLHGLTQLQGNIHQLAKWDGIAWSTMNPQLDTDIHVRVFALDTDADGNLYVGGYFKSTFQNGNTVTLNHVARHNGSEWIPLGSGIFGTSGVSSETVYALAVDAAGRLVVGGDFNAAGSNGVGYIAGCIACPTRALTVVSEHGTTVPPAGVNAIEQGTVLTNSAASQVVGGTQYVCRGWALTGNAPASGTGANFVMTLTNDCTLTWLWGTNLWFQYDAGTGGTIGGSNAGWYAFGSTVTVQAYPNLGYQFNGWSGDVPAGQENANPLTVTMDGARSLTVLWAISTSTITFDTAGGTPVAPLTQQEGTAITAPAAPTRPGYIFIGWSPALPATMPLGDVTCVAQWKLAQTITFPPIGTKRTTDTVGLVATASSGLPVAFSVASGPASLAGGTTLSFTGAGTVSIVASQAGNGSYYSAPDVTNTFTVILQMIGGTVYGAYGWTNVGSGLGPAGYVQDLVHDGTDLYAGGNFTNAGAVSVKYVAKWDGASWSQLGTGLRATDNPSQGGVVTMARNGANLYAGGRFNVAGGVAATNVAMWNGTSWSNMGRGFSANVNGLLHDGTSLYACGPFTQSGSNPSTVMRWTGTAWTQVGNLGAYSGAGTGGMAYGLAHDGANLYAAALTNYWQGMGSVTKYVVSKWNGAAWTTLGTANDYIWKVAYGGTTLYACGQFTSINGVAANRIAKWNGTSWSPLGSGLNGTAYGLYHDGTDLFVSGAFTTAGGLTVNRVAKWDGTTWTNIGSGMTGGYNFALTMLPVGANLYAGGGFTTAGVSRAVNIAQWKPSATEYSGVVPDSGSVAGGYQVVITGSNLGNGSDVTNVTLCGVSVASIVSQSATQIVVIAGATVTPGLGEVRVYSTSYGETARPDAFTYIAAATYQISFDANGGLGGGVQTVSSGVVPTPPTVTRAGYSFAGWSPVVGAATADVTYTAQWTANQSTITFNSAGGSEIAPITQNEGTAITPPANPTRAGYLFAGWAPALPGTMPVDDVTCVAQWTVAGQIGGISYGAYGWTNVGSGLGPDWWVRDLAHDGTYLYASGAFTNAGAVAARYVAKWDGSSWSPLGTGLRSTNPMLTGEVKAMASDGANLYVCGWFNEAGGVAATNVAVWNGTSWSNMGRGFTENAMDLLYDGTSLYACGNFTYGGLPSAVMRWTGTTWTPVGSLGAKVGFAGGVAYGLAHDGVNLYASHVQDEGGGILKHRVSKWDGVAWTTLGEANDYIWKVDYCGGTLYAGGIFTIFNGVAANRIAKWDGTSWTPLGSGLNANVVGLDHDGTNLLVSGTFTTAGGVAANRVAKWDGTTWTTFGSGMNGPGTAMLPVGANLYAGGGFTTAGVSRAINIAQWKPEATETSGVVPNSGLVTGGYQVVITGSNLGNGSDVTNVTLCGVSVASIVSQSATQIVVIAGATVTPGLGDVRVFSETQGETARPDAFTYIAPATHQITFSANGGTGGEVQTVDHGTVPTPPAVARAGYLFTGWDPEVGAATADVTYTAQWTLASTVTFNSAGGSAVAPITQAEGTAITRPANPTRAGYTFQGWAPDVPANMPADDVTCVAQWAVATYQITFSANGGTGGEVQTVAHGTVPTPPAVARAGYLFTGWDPEVGAATADVTYTAQWTLASTVTFDSAGGSAVAPITQAEGTAITRPANPTRAGYTFQNWLPDVPANMPADDVTCVAQWAVATYQITFSANGGTGGEVQTVDHGTVPTPPAVARAGYLFTGWDPEVGAATADVTYTAQWTLASTVTFNSTGGSAVAPITQAEGTAITRPANPTRAGYTFQNWLPDVPANMPADDVTCVAQWAVATYQITFSANGGTGGEVQTVDHGTVPTPPAVARAGYLFTGWDPAVGAATADVTYTAQWTLASTVTFNSAGGSAVAPITQAEGTAITRPANPTRAGYTFQGWAPDVPANMPADDFTCVAQWQAKADQVITSFWPTNGSVFFTTDRIGLSALATSGLPVGFGVVNGPGVLSDGTNLNFTSFGQVAVVASQPGDDNWNPAPSVTNFYTVHGIPVVGPITILRATNNLSLKVPQWHFLTNSVDPEGSALTVFWASPTSVNGGSATNLGYWTKYVPPLGDDSPDYFQFRVRNAFGGVAEGTAEVIVFNPIYNGRLCISHVTPSTTNTLVRFVGIPGRSYDVRSTSSLLNGPWLRIGEFTIGDRGYAVFTDTNAPAGQRFYRATKPE